MYCTWKKNPEKQQDLLFSCEIHKKSTVKEHESKFQPRLALLKNWTCVCYVIERKATFSCIHKIFLVSHISVHIQLLRIQAEVIWYTREERRRKDCFFVAFHSSLLFSRRIYFLHFIIDFLSLFIYGREEIVWIFCKRKYGNKCMELSLSDCNKSGN